MTSSSLFDDTADNIDMLAEKLYKKYKGKHIDALTLFHNDQVNTKYCLSHYTKALRKLVFDGKFMQYLLIIKSTE